jgi:hypothetical protein
MDELWIRLKALIGKKTDEAQTGGTVFSWLRLIYNHLSNNMSGSRMAKIDVIASGSVVANGSAVKQVLRGVFVRNSSNNYSRSVNFGATVNPGKILVFVEGYVATYSYNGSFLYAAPSISSVSSSGFTITDAPGSGTGWNANGTISWQAIEYY